jgi:hypothetical protein
LALKLSVASMTMLPSSNFCSVPFKPVVLEDPLALPEADGLVENGCGLPTGAANAMAAGTASTVAFWPPNRFGAAFLRLDFAIRFLAAFRFAGLAIDIAPFNRKRKRWKMRAMTQPYSDFGQG